MNAKAIVAGLLVSVSALAGAETAYVTDILRLGIHNAQDTSDRAFRNLVSGTELEVLERVPNYARVRTAEGQEGWVKSAYLVTEKPAQLRVAEVEAQISRLREQLDESGAAAMAARREAEQLSSQAQAEIDSAEAIRDTLARLKQDNEAYADRLESYRGSLPLSWVSIAVVVALVGGFLGGMWWLDLLSRRRHGGFRIY